MWTPPRTRVIPSNHWRVSVHPLTVRNHDNSPGWWSARVDRCWVAQRRDTYAIAPYFPMYPAFIFCTRGSLSGTTMVHHSGSIQSFKQQKGQCERCFCGCLCVITYFGWKCGSGQLYLMSRFREAFMICLTSWWSIWRRLVCYWCHWNTISFSWIDHERNNSFAYSRLDLMDLNVNCIDEFSRL